MVLEMAGLLLRGQTLEVCTAEKISLFFVQNASVFRHVLWSWCYASSR